MQGRELYTFERRAHFGTRARLTNTWNKWRARRWAPWRGFGPPGVSQGALGGEGPDSCKDSATQNGETMTNVSGLHLYTRLKRMRMYMCHNVCMVCP